MPEFEQSKGVHFMSRLLRPFNFIGGIGTLIIAFFVVILAGANFRTLLNLYFTGLLGVLLLAGEFNLTVINQNCKFLVAFLGRGFFDVFVGGWVYSLHYYFADSTDALVAFAALISFVVYIVSFPFLSSMNFLHSMFKILGTLGDRWVFHCYAFHWKEQVYLRYRKQLSSVPSNSY